MSAFTRAFFGRRGILILIALLGGMALVLTSVTPALGWYWGSSPAKECADHDWNGKWFKIEFEDRYHGLEVEDIETSHGIDADDIAFDVDRKTVHWTNESEYSVFKIVEKAAWWTTTHAPPDGSAAWLPGESASIEVSKWVSHLTWCFGTTPQPDISIDKTTNGADHSAGSPNYVLAGDPVNWRYEVNNEGNVPLANVVVTDSEDGVDPVYQSGDSDADEKLDVKETWIYTASSTADHDSTWDGGALNGYSNTGTVTAHYGETQVSDEDGSGYYASDPSINIDCTVNDVACDATDPVVVNVGDPVTWMFTVTNTGNVPLSAVVVVDIGGETEVEVCNLPDLDPDDVGTCDYVIDSAEPGVQTTTFEVRGADPLDNATDQATGTVSYEGNNEPVAVDDTPENEVVYEMNERESDDTPATLQTFADGNPPGVLDNDTDADDDVLTASDATDPTNGGTVILNGDGSFTYTPATDYPWGAGEFSRVDTWDYTVSDGNGGSDTGTVEITVNRVVCVDEEVTAESQLNGLVIGSFTLLRAELDPCKAYEVTAIEGGSDSADDDLIQLLLPGGVGGGVADFRGELTFSPQTLDSNDDFVLSLEYDPEDDGTFRNLLACVSADFDEDGLVTDADLPMGETWCSAAWSSRVVGSSEIVTTVQVFGTGDPGFSAR